MPLTDRPINESDVNRSDAGRQPSCVNALENVERNMFSSGPVNLSGIRYRGPRRLMFPVCVEVKDVDGTLWDVRDCGIPGMALTFASARRPATTAHFAAVRHA
jgi:hypothetical protein